MLASILAYDHRRVAQPEERNVIMNTSSTITERVARKDSLSRLIAALIAAAVILGLGAAYGGLTPGGTAAGQ